MGCIRWEIRGVGIVNWGKLLVFWLLVVINLGDVKVNGVGFELDVKGIDIGFKLDISDGCVFFCVLLEGGVGLLDGRVFGVFGVLLVELL